MSVSGPDEQNTPPGTDATTSPRVHLVLGAGGERGWDWIIGCLLAVADLTGFDPRRASSVVGTSVGSLVGAYLTHDVSIDVLARHVGGPPPPSGGGDGATVDTASGRLDGAIVAVRRAVGSLVGVAIRRTEDIPAVSDELGRRIDTSRWPEHLSIVAWDRSSRRRRVLRADTGLDLGLAVDASCAVPGLYPPVDIGLGSLIDGGVHSMTNADLVDAAEIDLSIVLAPSLSSDRRPNGLLGIPRWAHTVTVRDEVRSVSGLCVVLAPSRTWVAAAGEGDRRARVAAARAEALAALGSDHHIETLARLGRTG